MLRYAAFTDIGLVRKNNEDSLYIGCPWGGLEENLFVVADGMGGHKGGEYASRFVARRIPEILHSRGKKGNIDLALEEATEKVNAALYRISQESEELSGLGSTLVMAFWDKSRFHIINVGDSRAYLFADGELIQITEDHSLVEEMVRSGRLERDDEMYRANRNVITRAMGTEPYVEEDLFTAEAAPGSRLLLCTDGLHGMLEEEEIIRILSEEEDTEAAAERLVLEAKKGGGRDNITVILIDVLDTENS